MQENLTSKILYGFSLGVVLGVILNLFEIPSSNNILIFLTFGGELFLKTLKMMVVPVVFFSLVCGVCNLKNLNSLGRIGLKSIILYITTTFLAITLSLNLASIIGPGSEVNNLNIDQNIIVNKAPSLIDTFLNIVPDNPFKSLASGNMLQVIFFSILMGSGISLVKNNNSIKKFFNEINDSIMKILGIILKIAPFGIFCLISKTFASQGISTIFELIKYFLVVVLALGIQVLFVYIPLVKLLGKTKIKDFFIGIKDAIIFAFSTSSSSATIPVTLKSLEDNLKIRKKIASFTVPLGATINMDGTAIMQGVATVFIANLYGIDLMFNDFVSIIITATLASIGTAGVPGVGIIMLGMVLNQVGLPLEGIAIIMGVDRFLDMLRTSVNVTGDATISVIINKTEK